MKLVNQYLRPTLRVRITLNIDFASVSVQTASGTLSKRRTHNTEASHVRQISDQTEEADPTLWDEARRRCVFNGNQPRCQDGQESAKMACSQNASAVGFLEQADELGHALDTWSDTAAQYWVSAGRKGQIPLTGSFANFRMKLVLGETRMPLDCVMLARWRNDELRSWKALCQWVNIIRRVSPKSTFS